MSRPKNTNSTTEKGKRGHDLKWDEKNVGNDRNVPEYSHFGKNAIHK